MQIEPGTSPKHRYELIKATLLVIIGALITITVVYGIDYFSPKAEPTPVDVVEPVAQTEPIVEEISTPSPEPTPTPETPKEKVYTQDELNTIFEMDKKSKDTKLFYSPKLGVGFTYAPRKDFPESSLDRVKELENKICITDGVEDVNISPCGHSLEIFTKDTKDSLEQAITKEFLAVANPKDCFVSIKKDSSLYRGYISYIPDKTKLNDDNVYLGGAVNCPAKAMPTYIGNEGATSFFVLNEKDVSSNKYGFLNLGSGSVTANSGYKGDFEGSWFNTIRFLK
jgi:hypothetical protein